MSESNANGNTTSLLEKSVADAIRADLDAERPSCFPTAAVQEFLKDRGWSRTYGRPCDGDYHYYGATEPMNFYRDEIPIYTKLQ